MASGLDQAIKQVLDLCRSHPDGLPQKVLDEAIPDVELLMQTLNFLLEKKMLVVFSQGENLIYKKQSTEVAVKVPLATQSSNVFIEVLN